LDSQVTKSIIILWCVGSVVSTYFVWQDSSQLTELIDGKNTLIDQNNNLSNKIEEYKNNVDEKQKIIKELEGKLSAMDKYGEIAKWNFII
jgi:biopolymer transport protein ExbB/TolQ